MSDDKKTIERFTLLPNRYYIILEKVDEEQLKILEKAIDCINKDQNISILNSQFEKKKLKEVSDFFNRNKNIDLVANLPNNDSYFNYFLILRRISPNSFSCFRFISPCLANSNDAAIVDTIATLNSFLNFWVPLNLG